MTKRLSKVKEPVRLRSKNLKNGNQSLYLDIYRNGKRYYEFLKLYLVKGSTAEIRERYANTLRAANAIKAQRIMEIADSTAGITKSVHRGKMLLTDLLDNYLKYSIAHGCSNCREHTIMGANKHVKKFIHKNHSGNIAVKDVSKDFCIGFADYLIKEATVLHKYCKKRLTTNTQRSYFDHLVSVFNYAVQNDIIDVNPATKVPAHLKPKLQREVREYLVVDELHRLIRTPCKKEELKRMFLFSCFTGLRASDVTGLRWEDIEKDEDGGLELNKIMKKTGKWVNVPLSTPAKNFLPIKKDNAKPKDYVYTIRDIRNMTKHIVNWAKDSGIKKHVTFHVARHIFATLILTQGADIYTVCKLLGHSDVSVTQIYAKVIDKKKKEATHLLDNVL
jgi:site-specific recombinase XerD